MIELPYTLFKLIKEKEGEVERRKEPSYPPCHV